MNAIKPIHAWYYTGTIPDPKDTTVNTLVVDFFKQGYLMSFVHFSVAPATVNESFKLLELFLTKLRFYHKKLDMDKLRDAAMNGEGDYFYNEN